jgi:CheY-like chemotaxis protein
VHLIVADLGMPDVDGFDLIDQVRRMENGSGRAPAIAVSAYSQPDVCDKALTVGYSAYCPKPVDAFEFLRVVDQVLNAPGATGSHAGYVER